MSPAMAMTHAERLLRLAEQETDCRYLGDPDSGRHTLSCPGNCWQGTGKVPRFPTLRRACPWVHLHRSFAAGKAHITYDPKECPYCQSRGFVPIDNEAATLPCAFKWSFERSRTSGIVAMCRLTFNSAGSIECGPTPNEAAIAALYAEVQREKEKP